MNVLDALFRHDHELGQLIRHYEQMLLHPETDDNEVQQMLSKIEEANAWDYEVQVKTIISKLQLTPLLEQTM
jgi:ATP-binding cassette subfamily F protein uup